MSESFEMRTALEWLALRASRERDKPYLRFGDETIAFGELEARVRRMAAGLVRAGVRAGERVAVMVEPHPSHVDLFLALAWVGAVYVPVNPQLKQGGLSIQLADARPRVAIADRAYAGELEPVLAALPGVELVVWRGGGGAGFEALYADAPPPPPASGLDRAMMVSYTSGTTGKPKGAILTERWFQIGVKNTSLLSEAKAGDVFLLWEPFHHLAGWFTILLALRHGLEAAMVGRFSASRFWDQARRYKATKIHYLGGVVNILLRQPPSPLDRAHKVEIAWGGACPAASWRAFEERFGVRVREGYGLTEGSNFNMLNLTGKVGSIGRPIDEYEAKIAGEDGAACGAGEIGEIWLKPLVKGARPEGFVDPAREAEIYRPDGWIRSGDYGTRDQDGDYFFTGRKKDYLRRRGENVSAWEVERVLNDHPAVEDSAVIGVPSELGEDDIKAFVKPAPGETPDPAALVAWCAKRLAPFQVPRYVAVVDDFPRGPTQRIQKNFLPRDTAGDYDAEKVGGR